MKIHIIGPSGSGKTTLAQKLSNQYKIPFYELDDIFWDNSDGKFNKKRDPEKRNELLQNILQNKNWIIEGVQYSWLKDSFSQADIIYLMNISPFICRFRIIKRFVIRKWKCQNESLSSLISLLIWTKKFYQVNLLEIKEILLSYENKVIIINKRKDIDKIVY